MRDMIRGEADTVPTDDRRYSDRWWG